MYALDTAGLGPQLGNIATDYVLLVMTERGAERSSPANWVPMLPPWPVLPGRMPPTSTTPMSIACRILSRKACLPELRWAAHRGPVTTMPTKTSPVRRGMPRGYPRYRPPANRW